MTELATDPHALRALIASSEYQEFFKGIFENSLLTVHDSVKTYIESLPSNVFSWLVTSFLKITYFQWFILYIVVCIVCAYPGISKYFKWNLRGSYKVPNPRLVYRAPAPAIVYNPVPPRPRRVLALTGPTQPTKRVRSSQQASNKRRRV